MSDLNVPLVFKEEMEKNATFDMPQDATMWDEEVLKHLHEDHPELTEEDIEVVFKKTDAKKGYGYGFVALGKKGAIKIPIIIKEYKMSPLDVMLYEGKAFPLTPDTVKEIVQSTAIGKAVPKPEEPFAHVGPNITERVYPGLYSVFRPGLGGRVSAYKYASILSEIARTPEQTQGLKERLEKDPTLVAAWANSPCQEVLKKAYSDQPVMAVDSTPGNSKVNPDEVKPGEAHPLVDAFIKKVEGNKPIGPIVSPGLYEVEGQSGNDYQGMVFPMVYDFDLQKQDIMVFCGSKLEASKTDGKPYEIGNFSCVQQTIVGRPSADMACGKYIHSCEGMAGDKGIFYIRQDEGPAMAFLPVKIKSKTRMREERKMDFEKDQQHIQMTKNFDVIKYHVHDSLGRAFNVVVSPSAVNVQKVGDLVMMPANTKFSVFGTLVNLRKDTNQITKVADLRTVTMRHLGGESFSIDADWAEDWAKEGDLKSRIGPYMEAFYTPDSLEKCFSECRKVSKLSMRDRAPVRVRTEDLPPASHREASKLARDLTKIAAHLQDPGLVDTVLSLQFINKDNINKFVSFIPQLVQAASHLADLLIASRLGMQMSEYPIKSAMENLMEVIGDLRMIKGK
jgi:hypothetical protein